MSHTVQHLPIPASFPGFWKEIDFKRKKRTTIGPAEYFRDTNFPRTTVSEGRNIKEVAVCLYMIHLFKTNYQQGGKKKGQYPKATERKSSVSKLFLSSHYLPTWQSWLLKLYYTIPFYSHDTRRKGRKNSPIYPFFLLNYLKNRSALLLQGY